MKIAFVGASGYGNVGDDTYPIVFRETLREHEVIFYNSDLPESIPDDICLLVMGGGGIIYNSPRAMSGCASRHFQRMQFYMDRALGKGIPFGFSSCGFQFGPNEEPQYQNVLKAWIPYLQLAAFVTLRSQRCRQIASALTGRKDIVYAPDLAYLYNPCASEATTSKTFTIVPAGSVNPRNRFTQYLIRMFRSMDYRVVWLSMGADCDDSSNLRDAVELDPGSIVESRPLPSKAFEYIKGSRFVYSGRYHGMVFARRAEIPILVPQDAPYKIVAEDFTHPIANAKTHIEVIRHHLVKCARSQKHT